jgi:ferredoxin
VQLEYAIIGTGPSAVAAAAALIDAGLKPTFVDAGSLDNGKVRFAKTLKIGHLKSEEPSQIGSTGQKAWFGSYDPYLQKFETRMQFEETLNVRPSNAIGGFSRIWGATFEFWPADNRWPNQAKIDEIDFEKIKELMPLGEVSFEPAAKFLPGLAAASSSSRIYRRLISQINNSNIVATPARLAIETSGPNGCTHCLSCLDGCPQDSIWFSGSQIQKWLSNNQASLLEGLFVERINTRDGENQIQCVDINNNPKTLFAKKVYLAAGAVGTANVVLNSRKMSKIEIKDTSTLFTAGLSWNKQPEKEQGHTLSQFWLNWRGKDQISAQVYAPNIGNLGRLTSRFKILKVFKSWLSPLLLRLHPIIIYLDESKSPTIVMEQTSEGIEVFEGPNRDYKKFRKLSISKVRETFLSGGLLVPPVGTDYSPAGTGYHFGASLPMGRLSDDLGRIQGWENVHIVDSSVLPYLNVGSITPTVMANAHRIARQSLVFNN